jgi:nitrite reductase (NADH) large subunit
MHIFYKPKFLRLTEVIHTKMLIKQFLLVALLWVDQSSGFHATTKPIAGSVSPSGLHAEKKRVVVVGNGMVGQRFMENVLEHAGNDIQVSTFCEEPRAAYNRVKLTSYFETRNPSDLSMTSEFDEEGRTSWFSENGVELFMKDKVVSIDTDAKVVTGASGRKVPYDACVLATGSFPFVPPIPGKQRPGVFVYRTIEDLEGMLAYAEKHNVKAAAVIGGGLLGLEAAKAVKDMGIKSHIIEFADILMCRQIDQGGHNALVGKIKEMGLEVHCGARTEAFVGTDGTTDNDSMAPVSALKFSNEDWDDLPVQMVVVSAGIQPRDELARQSQTIDIGERGGVVVDDQLRTSIEGVYAIGEIALYKNFIYGLIAPGYDMAQVCAKAVANDLGIKSLDELPAFTGADMSTKLKLLGCDVASFGVNQPKPDDPDVQDLVWNDPFSGVYRKLIFNKAGTQLRGGILVGDASDYTTLHKLAVSTEDLPEGTTAAMLLPPPSCKSAADGGEEDVPSDPNAQICSCNNISRGDVVSTIRELGVEGASFAEVKKCSKAGTGCGGCEPVVKSILKTELEAMGGALSNHLCEHFPFSRQELVALMRIETDPSNVDSFAKVLAKHGNGSGCEICKPTVGSILASLQNKLILGDERSQMQDTNDRSLAK